MNKIKLSSIKLNPDNPRFITPERLARLKKSLTEFEKGLKYKPLLVDENSMLLGGNQRFIALTELGYKQIPEIWVKRANDLTEEEKKRLILLDNIEFGQWDKQALEDDFSDFLEDYDFEFEALEFEDFEEDNEPESKESEAKEPDLETKKFAISELGDLYEFVSSSKGIRHRVLCGDSTEVSKVEKLLAGEKANLLASDPPYGINKAEIKNDEYYKIDSIYESLAHNFRVFCDENASGYVFGLYPILYKFYELIIKNEFNFIQDLYWLKGTGRSVKGKYINAIENIMFFSKNESYIFNEYRKHYSNFKWLLSEGTMEIWKEIEEGGEAYYEKRFPKLHGLGGYKTYDGNRPLTNVLKYSTHKGFKESSKGNPYDLGDGKETVHPTMKEVEMFKDFINQSSQPSQIVLDTFLGSGTTLIACEQTNRNCYGMELEPLYVDVIVRRYIKYMNDNNLKFEILRNEKKLTNTEIDKFFE